MKRLLSFSAILLAVTTFAVGPKIPCILTFTPSPDASVTGYFFYYRTTNTVYTNTQRWSMPTNAATGFDLRVLGLPKGIYYVSASATNATTESDLSAEIQWTYQNPNKPTALQIVAP
jgi:hypothetical protein